MKMPQNIPRLIFWELTKKCNLSCIHCRAEAEELDFSGELELKEIQNIIDNIASFAKPILVLTGGEPLFRDDIFEIAAYAGKKEMRVALATNGTLIDEDIAKNIEKANIARVSISLDGWDETSHDSFRGVSGSFRDALRGTRLLRENGVEFQFNTTVTKRNVDHIDDILKLAEKESAKAVHLFMLVPVGCGVEIAETDMISSETYEETLHWFYRRSQQMEMEFKATCAPHYYRIIREEAKKEGRKISLEKDGMAAMTRGCLAGIGVCFISHSGEVQPCGYLPMSTGNVLNKPFDLIWKESPLFHSLRDYSMLKGKCGVCEYKSVCGGCRARAFYSFKDFLEEEPFCVYLPK